MAWWVATAHGETERGQDDDIARYARRQTVISSIESNRGMGETRNLELICLERSLLMPTAMLIHSIRRGMPKLWTA